MALSLQPARTQAAINEESFHRWLAPDGSVWASFHRLGSAYLIRFPGLADFQVSADGQDVVVFPVSAGSQPTIDHLYLNQVLPLALSRQLRLVLHGSAIEIGNAAIAFLGRSGRGKSTLAASFAAHGLRFITDDGLVLDESQTGVYMAQPSHPSIRLWEDSRQALLPATAIAPAIDYTPKLRLLAGAQAPFCPDPRPLRRIYILGGDSDTPRIAPITPRDAVIEAARNCFLLDIDERSVLKHHYAQLLALATRVPFFRLDYPRRYECLDEVRQAVIAHSTVD